MAHLQNTLETSGYVYNPFTTGDPFGAPTQLNLADLTKSELRVGADDSALPALVDPAFLNSAPLQGSGTNEKHTPPGEKAEISRQYLMLAGFIAVLALALYSRR